MPDQPLTEADYTYAKLRILSEAAQYLELTWDKSDREERAKNWWQVHKASREVWNILHPPEKANKLLRRMVTDQKGDRL